MRNEGETVSGRWTAEECLQFRYVFALLLLLLGKLMLMLLLLLLMFLLLLLLLMHILIVGTNVDIPETG